MLDIKLIRDNPDQVRQGLLNRGGRSIPDLDKVIQKNKEWRAILTELEELRAKRNKASEEIGRLKKEKKDADALMKDMESVKAAMKEREEKERILSEEAQNLLLTLPNIPDASVP